MADGLLVIGFPLDDALLERVRAAAVGWSVVRSMDKEAFLELLPQADIVFGNSLHLESIERGERLRWVQLLSAGADEDWIAPLARRGVAVTTTSGIHATPIGEYVVGTMLLHSRHWARLFRQQFAADWNRSDFEVRELEGGTVGVVGYGSIGRGIARLARGFGMRVLGLRRTPGAGDELAERMYGPRELHAMLGESDYVVVATPLTPETRGLIGRGELAAMRPEALLINIARGDVLDEQALIEALRARRIAGAALDVFEHEPLPADSPLWSLPNVILTPHISGVCDRYNERATTLFIENIERWRQGQPPRNRYDPDRGY